MALDNKVSVFRKALILFSLIYEEPRYPLLQFDLILTQDIKPALYSCFK